MVTVKEVQSKWAALYQEAIVLKTTKKINPKKYDSVHSQFLALLDDIEELLDKSVLKPADIDTLIKIREKAVPYAAI